MALGIAITVNGQADAELAAASQVEIYERMGEMTTFRLQYPLDVRSGDYPLLVDSRLDPGAELAIFVDGDGEDICLVKGKVYSQRIHLEHGTDGSWVEVFGADMALQMDRETRAAQWTDVTDSDVVTSVLGNYGFAADVSSTSSGHFETRHTLLQRESDLRFIRRLARRNGCLFWMSFDAEGVPTAHFKRPSVDGDGQVELIINLDLSNISALDVSWDVERPTSAEGAQLNLTDREILDGAVSDSGQSLLGGQGLTAITGDTRSLHLLAPADDAGDLQSRGAAALIEANWFIRATCETSLNALGKVVRAHTLVAVRGAGSRHSGKYFVAAVTHSIDAAAHRMSLTLLRNAWGVSP